MNKQKDLTDCYDTISIISKSTNLSDDNFSEAYEEIRDILLSNQNFITKNNQEKTEKLKMSIELPSLKSQNSKQVINHYDKKVEKTISNLKLTTSINNSLPIKNKSPITSVKNNFYSIASQEKFKPKLISTNIIRLKTAKKS